MICITSISPTHINKDIQSKAVKSWIDLGMKVCSLNSVEETKELQIIYPEVQFYSTERTLQATYGKPYVQISAILDLAKSLDSDEFCIINSDIELKSDKETIERTRSLMANNLVMANRINHNGDYKGAKYLQGIDVFFIHKRFLKYFPQSMHALGMTFVDYFLPYNATQNGIQTVFIEQEFAFHLNHKAQYSEDNWKKSGRYFLWEAGLYQFSDTNGIGKMSNFVYEYIYNAAEKKKI
jgi:hypothetical protein